ncbi:hypothetical protein HAX54_051726 [Datura stramonium]|uniref:Uncharacterized protein n=1 Tax=Datura stramonium TaxID=4076 RepID=A0ABS8SY34_DATST|nr:hypothetical protein [Datura stramonium]
MPIGLSSHRGLFQGPRNARIAPVLKYYTNSDIPSTVSQLGEEFHFCDYLPRKFYRYECENLQTYVRLFEYGAHVRRTHRKNIQAWYRTSGNGEARQLGPGVAPGRHSTMAPRSTSLRFLVAPRPLPIT